MNLRFHKKYLWMLFISLIVAIYISTPQLKYGLSQLSGQVKVLWEAKPLEDVLNNTSIPDSVKSKLKLVKSIKSFAFDSLGLKSNDSYSTVFVQNGEPILFNVTACDPFELKDHTWSFPLLGEVSYKGFFDTTLLNKEVEKLKEKGLDINVREVTAWSTLGFFNDPILTNFLNRSDGQLSNLIIHELTHGTVYVSDDVYFNENLASFIGDKGARIFLDHHFGPDSEQKLEYIQEEKDYKVVTDFVLNEASQLELLYDSIQEFPVSEKRVLKNEFMQRFTSRMKEISVLNVERYIPKLSRLNNTYFQSFKRYHNNQSKFEEEFSSFDDLPSYIKYVVFKYN